MQSDSDTEEDLHDGSQVTNSYNKPEPLVIRSWRSNGLIDRGERDEPRSQQPTKQSPDVDANHYGQCNNLRYTYDATAEARNNNKQNMNEKQSHLYSSDLRISKLLRRLLAEHNPNKALELCQKLEVAVRSPANTAYICRSFDLLMDNMMSLLKHCPVEILSQVSIILGLLGYINRNDFPVYKNYITKAYQSNKDLQNYLMLALKTTINADAVNLHLMVYSERLLVVLKDYLENAVKVEDFMAVSETIADFAKNYTRAFENHFTDIVDIIVGWHLEANQPQSLKLHCSAVLQCFSIYFLKSLKFTLGLLGQFHEDLMLIGEELNMDKTNKKKTEMRIGAFVGAFSSICKTLTNNNQLLLCGKAREFINDAFHVILQLYARILRSKLVSEDTALQINDFLYFLFSHNYDHNQMLQVQELIVLQLKHMSQASRKQNNSCLCLILSVIRQQRTQLPCTLVTVLFEPTPKNSLNTMILTNDTKLYRLLLAIYHEVLIIKNVPLLQAAYKHIQTDVILNVQHLQQVDLPLLAETKLNFYLTALSVLALQTSSIIGMYALDPSILELLIVKFQAARMSVWQKHATLHAALLHLIVLHCQKNHNFRASSRLLQTKSLTEDWKGSPNSLNFGIILQFLADILPQSQCLSIANLNSLLEWLLSILTECSTQLHILAREIHFQHICLALTQTTKYAALPTAKCMVILLKSGINLSRDMLQRWYNIPYQQLESFDLQVQKSYTLILAYMPLDEFMPNVPQQLKLNELQHAYKANANFAPVQAKYFKPFLEALNLNEHSDNKLTINDLNAQFLRIFENSWISQTFTMPYENAIYESSSLLNNWLQHEMARFCVRNKLRTTLGKPQHTFLGIEAIIMEYARLLATLNTTVTTFKQLIMMQCKVRLLLGFLECLEKQVYNAAEGTAFALLAVEKPAKTFFRINTSTCDSWFQRIRNGVNLLAAQCQQPQIVIRQTQSVLQNNHEEHTLIMLANALLAAEEADTLLGLYAWLKGKTGQRHVWLQHAAEQAAGNKELAAAGYQTLLQDRLVKMSAELKKFIQNQLLECYYYSGQWQIMQEMLDAQPELRNLCNSRSQAHLKTVDMLIFGNPNFDLLFGSVACQAVLSMAAWPEQQTKPATCCSYGQIISHLEDNCIMRILQPSYTTRTMLSEDVMSALQKATREALRYEQCQVRELLLLHKAAQALQDNALQTDFNCHPTRCSSSLLYKSLLWTLLYNMKREEPLAARHAVSLYLDLAKSARNEGNVQFSAALLERALHLKGCNQSLKELSVCLQAPECELNLEDNLLLRACDELTHCLWSTPNKQMEAINLSANICQQLLHSKVTTTCTADILLTLADWTAAKNMNDLTNAQPLQRLLAYLPEIPVTANEVQEKVIGKLLHASVLQHNAAGNAWSAFGNWCYRWGKKLVELKNAGKLSANDMSAIQKILDENVDNATLQQLTQTLENLQLHDGMEDIENSEISTMELLETELRKIELLKCKPVAQINSIIDIWRQAHKSVFAYYELAAQAYFKYLALETPQSQLSDASFVTITLRLLRLVVKHAIGLQDTLEQGLQSTPLRAWRSIIPQLFSRLNHHEPYVRKSVAELLCRLALDRPHLVIFPAVVGAQQQLRDNDNNNKQLRNCFSMLLSTLQQQAPDTVLHVQLLVRELKRVALLWEEHWMNALAQLYAEYAPLFNSLETEIRKGARTKLVESKYALLTQHVLIDFQKIVNSTAKTPETNYERQFQERYNEMIANTVSALQQPLNLTKPNVHWLSIKQLYNLLQQRALRSNATTLKVQDLSPVLALMKDTAICMPGVDNYEREQPIYIRSVENAVYVLPTKTKPKKLAFLGSDGRKYTYLFKGLEDLHLDERIMQFLSIANAMMARAANDTPKIISGNDQFRANHYSVIPLGPQSGLISWVEGVTPLFTIYKKWQQRDALIKQQQKERPGSQPQQTQQQQQNTLPTVARPSEIFFNKLTPLLAEHNIKITDPRKQWPLATLRRVLTELCEETPRDLLAKELWCYANNAAEWRKAVRCYAKSVAVMSIIGYVIGLGDRHLDNVLIKLSTGEIVHIDYNVCFEKGKTLRVPEKVPFRLTPNFEEALGITGIEGAFRLGCEHVLKTLRKERETLLTLLEAFVYDPLMDWTVGDDGSATATRTTSAHAASLAMAALESSKEADDANKASKLHEIPPRKEDWQTTRQNIHLRVNELKPHWTKYKTEVLATLRKTDWHIEQVVRKREEIVNCEHQRSNISKELALIHELEALGSALGSHSLNTLSERYAVYRQSCNALDIVKQRVQEFQHEYEKLLHIYFERLLPSSAGAELQLLQAQLCQQQQNLQCNEFEILHPVLEQHGHLPIYELCDFVRKEMDNILFQQRRSALNCLEQLLQYANIMKYFPRVRLRQHRFVNYAKWYFQLFQEQLEPSALRQELEHSNELENTPIATEQQTAILQYYQGMEERCIALNYELRSVMSELCELEEHVIAVEIAENSMQSFIAANVAVHTSGVEISMLQLLLKTNAGFLQYEQNALNQGENNLLQQQVHYIKIVQTVCKYAYCANENETLPVPLQQRKEALDTLHDALECLQTLKCSLEILLPEALLPLYMQCDEDSKKTAALATMCVAPKSAEEWLKSEDFNNYHDLINLLETIYAQFNEVEQRIRQLRSVERVLKDSAMESSYKQFASEKTALCNLLDLRNEAVAKIFCAARDAVTALNNNDATRIYEISDISTPLIHYINQLQTNYLLGLTSFFCYEISEACVKDTTIDITEDIMSNALMNCENLIIALQQSNTLKSQEALVLQYSKWVEHYTLVCSAHYWTNERWLRDQLLGNHIIQRENLLNNVRSNYQSLEVWQQTVVKIELDMQQHTNTVMQLSEVTHLQYEFYEQASNQRLRTQAQQGTCNQLLELAQVLLRFEMMQSGSSQLVEADVIFLTLLQQWQECYNIWRQTSANITPVEQDIVQLLNPEGKVDQCWINNITGLLDDMNYSVHRELAKIESEEQQLQETLQAEVLQLQALIEAPIRVDTKMLLKYISKLEKQLRSSNSEMSGLVARARELQQKLKLFYSKLSELQLKISARDLPDNALLHLRERINESITDIEGRYIDFMQIVQRTSTNALSNSPQKALMSHSDESTQYCEAFEQTCEKDKKVNKGQQQKRNAYAVSVWKRIRMKLEGRDPDANRRSSVNEQVDYVIREAMNPDNLAVLYEGWTPWV